MAERIYIECYTNKPLPEGINRRFCGISILKDKYDENPLEMMGIAMTRLLEDLKRSRNIEIVDEIKVFDSKTFFKILEENKQKKEKI